MHAEQLSEKGWGRVGGKVALVTSATTVLGEAICLRLAEEGAKLVITGTDPHRGQAIVGTIRAAGGEATYFNVDPLDEEAIQDVVGDVMTAHGRIDILVNNAGQQTPAHFDESSPTEFWVVLDTWGLAYCCAMWAVLPVMKGKRGGSVVNLGTSASLIPDAGAPLFCFAMAGLAVMTKALSLEYGPYGIRVNMVSADAVSADAPNFGGAEEACSWTRRTTPREVANVVLWLVSDEAAHVSGQNVRVGSAVMG